MTRFDADAPAERRKLFAEGIAAHRERGSAFVTFEAHEDATASDEIIGDANDDHAPDADLDPDDPEDDADDADGGAPERAPPWVQFADGTLNLDCTEGELDALKDLLGEFPAFKVDELTRPENAEGVNVRVSALADPNRVAGFVERAFREVFDQPEDFRAWVTEV